MTRAREDGPRPGGRGSARRSLLPSSGRAFRRRQHRQPPRCAAQPRDGPCWANSGAARRAADPARVRGVCRGPARPRPLPRPPRAPPLPAAAALAGAARSGSPQRRCLRASGCSGNSLCRLHASGSSGLF